MTDNTDTAPTLSSQVETELGTINILRGRNDTAFVEIDGQTIGGFPRQPVNAKKTTGRYFNSMSN